jgi:transposase InsO family protein
VRYAFIKAHQEQFHLARLCRVLEVSKSGYYAWRDRAQSARVGANSCLLAEIRRLHDAHFQAYGALKTWRALKAEGIQCGKHRVARLRREHGIEAKRTRRFRSIVEHHHTAAPAADLIVRRFRAAQPDQAWVGDLTFIRTRQGWLYLAMLLDLFSRRVVGWAMGERPDEALTLGALEMAIAQREPAPGLIHHTDQGVIYRSRTYRARLESLGMRASMGAKGSAHDNAVAESFFSNLKNELVHHCRFESRELARAAIFSYVELFYNRRRLHQTLGYRTPMEFEQSYENGA